MLTELRLRNLAVIEEMTVPFGAGLNAVTGETGAGKSIVVDAILLVMGARAQPDLIRSGAESAIIEAVFELPPGHPATEVLEAAGHAAPDGTLVIKREISRMGRHRVFVNDSAATVALLERLGESPRGAARPARAPAPDGAGPAARPSRPLRGRRGGPRPRGRAGEGVGGGGHRALPAARRGARGRAPAGPLPLPALRDRRPRPP